MWSSTTVPTVDGMISITSRGWFFCKASSCSASSVLESRWTSHHRRNSPNACKACGQVRYFIRDEDQLFLNLPNYILYGQTKKIDIVYINKHIHMYCISICIIVGGEQYYTSRKKESGQVQLSIHVQKKNSDMQKKYEKQNCHHKR